MPSQRTDTLKSPCAPGATVAYTGTAGTIDQKIIGDTLMVYCTTDAWIALGKTATVTDTPIPAYTPMFIPMPTNTQNTANGARWSAGESCISMVSAVQVSSGGSLFVQQFI